MKETTISKASDTRCELGENPLWDEQRQCVFWTDIKGGKLYQLDIGSGVHHCIYTGDPVGGFTLQENGDLLLFRVSDIALFSVGIGRITPVRQFQDEGMERFNDVCADPEGRVFAGTQGTESDTAGLYRVDLDGSITKLFAGTQVANGMGFSPDLRNFYWTCSTSKQIFVFDYDKSSGAISNRRLFYAVKPEEGTPDGLAVDAEGCVWSARWGASGIKRHALDGTIISSVSTPVRYVSSLCFGGGDLDQLYVTTARKEDEHSEMAGVLLTFPSEVRGKLEFRSKVVGK